MRLLARRLAESPRHAVMTALLTVIALGTTVTVTLAVDGARDEPSLRSQLARERAERTELAQQLIAATTNLSTLRRTLDRHAEALRSARRQRGAALRARHATTARLTAVWKALDRRTQALRFARRQRDDARRASQRAERVALDALRAARSARGRTTPGRLPNPG
jgi:chromosome segregation ATPase